MGMTRVFYMMKKNQLTSEKVHEKLAESAGSEQLSCTVFYQEALDWLPVFDQWHCEGRYDADEKFMTSLGRVFGSPVIALSVFDSDAAFVSVYENGEQHRYVCASENMLEEFGFEEYEPTIPSELGKYVEEEELQKIWSGHYTFAEDQLEDMAQLLNSFLAFDEEGEEDVEAIQSV